jgi:hypothetical protein
MAGNELQSRLNHQRLELYPSSFLLLRFAIPLAGRSQLIILFIPPCPTQSIAQIDVQIDVQIDIYSLISSALLDLSLARVDSYTSNVLYRSILASPDAWFP